MAERKPRKAPRRREPTLREEIEASGETEKDALQVALDEVREDMRFLGREFCSWLLFHAEEGEAAFGTGEEAFTIRPGARLTLKALAGDLTELKLAGGAPGATPEARYALGRGAPVVQLELTLEQGERAWSFVLDADTLDLGRVKLPAVLAEEEDDQSDERLYLLEELDALLERAFKDWLALRSGPKWAQALEAMARWVRPER